MDLSLVRDLARWTENALNALGVKALPPSPPPPPPPAPVSSGFLLNPHTRGFVRLAGLSGTLAICLGVYGAHVMRENTSDELKRLFQLAQTYHLLHSVALLALPLVSRPAITGALFASGMTLFCGPMYYHAIRNDAQFRRVTPYGGILLLAGWLSVVLL